MDWFQKVTFRDKINNLTPERMLTGAAESILSSSLALLSKAKASVTDCTPTSHPRSSPVGIGLESFFHGHSLLYP